MRLTSLHRLLLICLAALVFRLALLLIFVQYPGIADPTHYYNMGVRLVEGHGFTINYIWQYNDSYAAVVHPDDYWMPLTGVLAALPMSLFGVGVHQALLLFILIGSLLPALAYWAARQFGSAEETSLFAAACVAFLPELVLNSLRTDTTIPNALLVCASILLVTEGLRRGRVRAFLGSGVAAGLAYLTRSENVLLLVMLPVALLLYVLWHQPSRWRYALLVPVIAALIALPWSLRNLSINGTISTPTTSNMFFLTDYRDHYVYDRQLTLQSYLTSVPLGALIGRRLFEMAASVKVMITTLGIFLPVAVIGGAGLLLRDFFRDRFSVRKCWLALAPTLILLLGFFIFYTVFAPFKSQGGSFKKAYLSLIPLLLPLAAFALERAVPDARIRLGAMALVVALLAAIAVDTVRLDADANIIYLDYMGKMMAVEKTLPDTNGDGQIVLMAQDPYIIGYLGIESVTFPNEDRDTVIQVARRYSVDYLLMPPNRASLDGLLTGDVIDPRFVEVTAVPGTNLIFYSIKDAAGG
ncbi:MAG: glycosyltransferase family 39 protein [Anaerolineae bacterium]